MEEKCKKAGSQVIGETPKVTPRPSSQRCRGAASYALREFMSQKPILLATTSTMDLNVAALSEAGIAEVFHRPLVNTELAAALARCPRPPTTLGSQRGLSA
jgi:hypothetical protein